MTETLKIFCEPFIIVGFFLTVIIVTALTIAVINVIFEIWKEHRKGEKK